MASGSNPQKAQFAGFELDLSSGELCRNGGRVRLQGQPFLVLRLLLDRAGEVVTRDELQRNLWQDETFVNFDHGLNKAIAKLRDSLDDQKTPSRLIETLPRRGYRLNAAVDWIGPLDSSPVSVPSAKAPARGLNRLLPLSAAAVCLVLVPALALSWNRVSPWFRARPAIQSIAVLPLVNLSNDPEQEYVADGMTEELITDLSYVKSLRVVSRASTIGFKASHLSAAQIADQLHVDALIEGSVLRVDHRVRVNIRLTAANPERQLWAATYDRDLTDAITLQNQIAGEAVSQIRAQLAPQERARLNLESRINPDAYDEYLRGRYFLTQGTDQKTKAIPHLEDAIKLDPNFAPAYAALGEAWGLQGVWGTESNRTASKKALEYSQKAVSLDPNSSEAFMAMGHSLMQSHRWGEGEVALRHAIDLDPNNAKASVYLALLLSQRGRVDESLMISHEVAIANPVALDYQRAYADTLYRARKYDDAIGRCERILELDPNHIAIYTTLANAYVEEGRYAEAEEAFKRGELMDPGVQAWLDARKGDSAGARRILKSNPSLVNVHSAVARYLVGDQDTGIKELDYLANEKWAVKTYHLRNDPTFDAMRSDPRFSAIVRKTGLLDD